MAVPHGVSPPLSETSCLVVGTEADPISSTFRTCAGAAGLRTRLIEAPRLGEASVVLDGVTLVVDGEQVGGLLFRGRSHGDFSEGFRDEDRVFVDVELAAVWLAAMQLPAVRSVNRFDAQAWYEISPWAAWTSRLAGAGIPTAPVAVGDAAPRDGRWWLPYTESALRPLPERHTRRMLATPTVDGDGAWQFLAVAGEAVGEANDGPAERVARALGDFGIQLARVTMNGRAEALAVDTMPLVADDTIAEAAAERLVRWLLS